MRQYTSAAACSNRGCIRANNEDNFFLNGEFMEKSRMDSGGVFLTRSSIKRQLYAVCDGMGGQEAGEEAAYAGVASMNGLLDSLINEDDIYGCINYYVKVVNEMVLGIGDSKNAGCTVAMLYLNGGQAVVAHLGDSRVYLMRDGILRRLTEDHNEVQRLVNMGILTADQAKSHPMRHTVTRYLGMETCEIALEPSYCQLPLRGKDLFLICSDGLTDMLEDSEIALFLRGTSSDVATKLVRAALDKGGRDNVTAVVVKIDKLRFL